MQMNCPAGHSLPHQTCTPVYCSVAPLPQQLKQLKHQARRKEQITKEQVEEKIQELKNNTPTFQLAESAADEKNAIAQGRAASRHRILHTPQDLTGSDAEEWADARITSLLPLAVSEIEWGLKFGDDDMRARAASKIMDATGRGKKENGSNATAPIILLQGTSIPWLKREIINDDS